MIATIPVGSKEAIRIPVRATGISAATLATYVVEVGIVATSAEPVGSEWKTGTWSVPIDPDHPAAILVIGPGALSGVVLTADITYHTWVRVTGDGQSPVVSGGALKAIT